MRNILHCGILNMAYITTKSRKPTHGKLLTE
nr:unnamed protein product [Callosobruchus chinensis]